MIHTVKSFIVVNETEVDVFLKFSCFFDDGHSDWCEIILHSGFDLYFSNNEWCWASFHVFISYLYVFFGEMFFYIFFPLFDSDQISPSVVSDSLRPHESQHARPPCPSPTLGSCSNSCPLSWWCHPTVSSSVVPFSSCLQSFPASGSFQWVSSSNQVPKKTYRWLINTWKDAQHHSLLEKCKSKLQWGTISHQSEWPSSKSLQTINARERV